MDLTNAAAVYCTFVGLTFLGLWLWYDRRDHRRFELERRKARFALQTICCAGGLGTATIIERLG